jgi:RES domain-containing protein
MVYTSSHRALAVLEALVHFEIATAPPDLVFIPVGIPSRAIRALPDADLPTDWASLPAPESTRQLGSAWAQRGALSGTSESLVLSVPSAVLPADRNYLINPQHPDIHELETGDPEPFAFDSRLLP